jgi:riboflavin synthase alpha subunit
MKIGIAGQLKVGDKVNVERAMAAHTRFGGHMVQVSIPYRLSPVFSDQTATSTLY